MFVNLFVAFFIFQANLSFQLQNKTWYKFQHQKCLMHPCKSWFLLLKKQNSFFYNQTKSNTQNSMDLTHINYCSR